LSRSNWSHFTVQDFIDRGEAKLQTGPFGTQLHSSDYVESGIPLINPRNVGFGHLIPEKLEYISDETAKRLKVHRLIKGDIVFGRKGTVERHILIKNEQQGWFQGSDCLRIRFKSPIINNQFISYQFLTENHKQWMIGQSSHGATMTSLNQDIVSRIPLILPHIQIQNKIAAILSAYDDLIENNTRRIRILEEMAQAIYREWFVHFRFPGHEGVRMVESEMGMIPEGWIVLKVGDKFKTVLGGTPSRVKPEYWENGLIPWINSGKVNELRIIIPTEYISQLGYNQSSTKLMPKRTTLIAITGATLGQVSLLEIEACGNQSIVGIYDPEELYSEYLYLNFSSNISSIIQHASGGAQQHINKEIINDVKIIIPPKMLINDFSSFEKPLFDLIEILFCKNEILRRTRDLLLPKLISGELDVSELDIMILEVMT